jgi:hypothetical protein
MLDHAVDSNLVGMDNAGKKVHLKELSLQKLPALYHMADSFWFEREECQKVAIYVAKR